jgi:hypothetical protein
MFTLKKHLVLALTLSTLGAQAHQEKKRNSLEKNTTELIKSTTKTIKKAFCATSQGADHLLYPALCVVVGKNAYNKGFDTVLPSAPEGLKKIENYAPVVHSARNTLTYLIIGGALYTGVNYLSSITEVHEFLQKNMPHLSALLEYLKVDFSSEETAIKE